MAWVFCSHRGVRAGRWFASAAACLLGCAVAAAAAPQGQPSAGGQQTASSQPANRPQQPQQAYRGLFGAGTPARPGAHAFDFTLSVYQEYGSSVDDELSASGQLLDEGWFSGLRGGLSFEKAGQRTRFGLRSEGWFRYYQQTRETTDPRVRVAMAIDSQPGQGRETRWHVGGTYDLEPYFILPLFGGGAPVTGGTAILPTGRDDLLFASRRQVFGQSFSFERQIRSRWTTGVFEDVRFSRADNPLYDVRSVHAGARLGRRFSRYAALRLGYAYQMGEFGLNAGERLETQDIQVSLDYRRPLPRLRRTTFGFETGSSRVTTAGVPRWEIVGTANLHHEFDEGWFIRADFTRGVRLVEGFREPFLQNTASGSLGGFIGRRVELSASGGYSRGDIGAAADQYEAVQGAARLRLALARFLAVDVEGLAYRHTFDQAVVAPGPLSAAVNRWSVRCNVSLWLPLSR